MFKRQEENKVASEAGCLHEALDPVHVMRVLILILAGRGRPCVNNSGAPSWEPRVSSGLGQVARDPDVPSAK